MADKRLVLAVAGSGKTKLIIDSLDLEKRSFIVTYTNTNSDLIRRRIIKKFSYFPSNIKVFTYFDFLYNFCVKPFVHYKYKVKGLFLDNPPDFTVYLKNSNLKKYISTNNYFYKNRLAKFIEYENLTDDVNRRLEMFCDNFFYDEAQDLGGHDFNFILNLTKANVNFMFTGDFYQNTYVTSWDGNTNNTLYSDFESFKKRYTGYNINLDINTLSNSHRCSPTICNYITTNLGINIGSHRNDETTIQPIDNPEKIQELLDNNEIIKLVYDKSHSKKFNCKNWGECKGEDDYIDTCIILNKTTYKLYKANKLHELAPRTKNKLYVAFSRTRGNCFLINEDSLP